MLCDVHRCCIAVGGFYKPAAVEYYLAGVVVASFNLSLKTLQWVCDVMMRVTHSTHTCTENAEHAHSHGAATAMHSDPNDAFYLPCAQE
jgi:hypothetical protein